MNETLLNKKISIERCLSQVEKYYALDTGTPFQTDYLRQDAVSMNLQRACELAIDMANHVIKVKKLGLPQDSRESFSLLHHGGLISVEQMRTLQSMVGFRNILVHEYRKLEVNILVKVVEGRMWELLNFADAMLEAVA